MKSKSFNFKANIQVFCFTDKIENHHRPSRKYRWEKNYAMSRDLIKHSKCCFPCICNAISQKSVSYFKTAKLHWKSINHVFVSICGFQIENPEAFKAIIGRLPYELRKKWRARANHISEEQFKEIEFQDIVKFIEKEARMASHPIFGDISTKKEQTSDKHQKPKKSTFTTVAAPTKTSTDSSKEKQLTSIPTPPRKNVTTLLMSATTSRNWT